MFNHQHSGLRVSKSIVPVRWTWSAAALALLAGTSVGMAQSAGFSDLVDNVAERVDAMDEAEDVYADEFGTDFEQYESAEPMDDPFEDVDTGDLNNKVNVNEYDLVDLHVNDENLGTVLQLLSIQSQRNIVSSNNVSATVTADLYGVTFYEALDAILHVNGFGYVEKGNFIYVYTREEIIEIEAMNRQLVYEVIHLDYLNAFDAGEFVRPLLSDSGEIKSNAQTLPFGISDEYPEGNESFANASTLVIYDFEENVEAIRELIGRLDTKPVQVLVEATILQTAINEANAFGVDFSILNNLDFKDFVGNGGPLGAVLGLIDGFGTTKDGTKVDTPADNGAAIASNVGRQDGPATLRAGIVNEDVAVFLRLLDEVTDVTVVSNPKILTLNRQPARVLVGTKVGYLSSTSTETATTESVEFLDTGTSLTVRPFISDDGVIRLELKPQVSSATFREVSSDSGGSVTIPDEDTTQMTTNVMVGDGQTVVLGGLFTETTTSTRRQVPGLGDIPIVGVPFRGHDDSTRRGEIIFMITPSIVNDTILASQGEAANDMLARTRIGARNGLLPWSTGRQVSGLLIQATELEAEGKIEEALFKVERALSLDPNEVHAIEMRERLTSKREWAPSFSVLESVLHGSPTGGQSALPQNTAPTDAVEFEYADETPVEPEFNDDSVVLDDDAMSIDFLLDESETAAVDADAFLEQFENEGETAHLEDGEFTEPSFEENDQFAEFENDQNASDESFADAESESDWSDDSESFESENFESETAEVETENFSWNNEDESFDSEHESDAAEFEAVETAEVETGDLTWNDDFENPAQFDEWGFPVDAEAQEAWENAYIVRIPLPGGGFWQLPIFNAFGAETGESSVSEADSSFDDEFGFEDESEDTFSKALIDLIEGFDK